MKNATATQAHGEVLGNTRCLHLLCVFNFRWLPFLLRVSDFPGLLLSKLEFTFEHRNVDGRQAPRLFNVRNRRTWRSVIGER